MGSKADIWTRVRRFICAECDDSVQAFHKLCSDWDYDEAGYFDMLDIEGEESREKIKQAWELFDSNPDDAFLIFLRCARSGSPIAMYWVGYCYDVGSGILADTWKAEQWYTKAINAGSWFALLARAKLFDSTGRIEECDAGLQEGMDAGFGWAHYWMARLRYLRSPNRRTAKTVKHLLETAMEKGHPKAEYAFGRLCFSGRLGLGQIGRGIRMLRAHIEKYPAGFEKAGDKPASSGTVIADRDRAASDGA